MHRVWLLQGHSSARWSGRDLVSPSSSEDVGGHAGPPSKSVPGGCTGGRSTDMGEAASTPVRPGQVPGWLQTSGRLPCRGPAAEGQRQGSVCPPRRSCAQGLWSARPLRLAWRLFLRQEQQGRTWGTHSRVSGQPDCNFLRTLRCVQGGCARLHPPTLRGLVPLHVLNNIAAPHLFIFTLLTGASLWF